MDTRWSKFRSRSETMSPARGPLEQVADGDFRNLS